VATLVLFVGSRATLGGERTAPLAASTDPVVTPRVPAQTFTRSEADYLEAVKLCLERGADVNATNTLQLAAIHGAANRGWVPIIQLLADHGAILDRADVGGRTPLVFAEGVFLAIRPPVAKPDAIALLKQLMAK
jgi:hypothetical protein